VTGARITDQGGRAGRPGDAGFTLLEVLVAFAIAAPVVALLLGQGVEAVRTSRAAAQTREAVSRAESRLATLADAALRPGERDGDDGNGFRWHTRVAPVASAAPLRGPRPGSLYAAGTALYDVTVAVTWPGAGPRAVTLRTRRLGPAAVAP
jgi:general secretion pathway protein I